jgi:hypothetical protein
VGLPLNNHLFSVMLLLCLVPIAFVSPVKAQDDVTCGALENEVTVDGKWTSNQEWVDAFQIALTFVQGSGEAYFKAKHDANRLYVLLDFVSDQETQEGDSGGVLIDANNDGGQTPQPDDFQLTGRWNSATQFWSGMAKGTGTEWGSYTVLPAGFKAASSKNAANDPYSTSSHLIYELQIPLNQLNPTEIGIYVYLFDRQVNQAVWVGTPMENPSQYAHMTFTSQVVPEFPAASVILLALLAGTTLLLRRSPRQKLKA